MKKPSIFLCVFLFFLAGSVQSTFGMQGSTVEDAMVSAMQAINAATKAENAVSQLASEVREIQNIEDRLKDRGSTFVWQAQRAKDQAVSAKDEAVKEISAISKSSERVLQDIRKTAQQEMSQQKMSEIGELTKKANQLKQDGERALRKLVGEIGQAKDRAENAISGYAADRIAEVTEQARRTTEATIEQLKEIGTTEIEKLRKQFNLTTNEAARLKQEFKEKLHAESMGMQRKQIDVKKEMMERKEGLSREEREAATKLEEQKAKTVLEEAGIKAQAEKETELAKQKAEQKFEIEHQEELAKTRREQMQQKIKTTFKEVTKMLNDGKTVRNLAITTGLTIAGILAVKHALPIIQKKVEEFLFTPPLIDDSSFTGFAGYFTKKSLPDQTIANLYFNPKLKQQVDRIIAVLKNTSKNKGYYLNYLFYGEPGTGKTATARAFSYESGMDYAIMSGGNVQKLLASGKAEQKLKDVFKWAKNSKKGMILFIDEADAFLKDPNKYAMTDELYAVLNSFLNMTGTESKDIAIIMSTNHPQNLPKAILDRVGPGQYIYFGLPEYPERLRMVGHFVDKYLGNYFYNDVSEGEVPGINEQLKNEIVEYIAQKTDKFSGRNISYLILAIEKALQAEGHEKVSKELIDQIVEQAVEQRAAAQTFGSFA